MSTRCRVLQLLANTLSRDTATRITVTLSLITLLGLSCPIWADGNNRANEAAAIFNSYCLNKSSGAAALDHRATEAHYEVFIDRSIPMPDGQVMKQKNWLIPTQDGAAFMLTSNDGIDGSQHVFVCGIYVPDLGKEAMESALSVLPRLGLPARHSQGNGESMLTCWLARVGKDLPSDDSQVMLSGDVPGMPGSNVNLILKTRLDH